MKMKLAWGAAGVKWGDPLVWGQEYIDVPSEDASLGVENSVALGGAVMTSPVLRAASLEEPEITESKNTISKPRLGKVG